MNQQSNSEMDNQSSVGEGVLRGVTGGTIEGVLEDLNVQDAEVVTGGHGSTTILVVGRGGLRVQEILH